MNDKEQPILCLSSRMYLEDIPCEIVLDDPGYQHLHIPPDEASKAWFEETFRDRLNADVIPVIVTSKIHGDYSMISTLVATNGKWGAYVATDRQLEQKEQPFYLAPFERPSKAVEAIEECWQGQFLGFTDYGSFWEQIVNAGISKPDVMPHLENKEPYPREVWKMSRVKTCLICKQTV